MGGEGEVNYHSASTGSIGHACLRGGAGDTVAALLQVRYGRGGVGATEQSEHERENEKSLHDVGGLFNKAGATSPTLSGKSVEQSCGQVQGIGG